MPSGKLSVSPLTISGLAQNGFPTSQTFIGCYISPSEKHRTNSANGPEPQYHDTLQCNVSEVDHTLFIDVINEDPTRPGLIGSTSLPLNSAFEKGCFEDWVPLSTTTGSPFGYVFIRLNFTPSKPKEAEGNPYRVLPPPPTFYQEGAMVGEVPEAHGGPQSPIPDGVQPTRENSSNSMPYYSHGNGVPPPVYTPPVQHTETATPPPVPFPATIDTSFSTFSPVTEKPKKKSVPEWMKLGGAALAGAAAVGFGSWTVNALGSDDEAKEEDIEKRNHEAHQRTMHEEAYYPQSYQAQPPPPAEVAAVAKVYEEREVAEVHEEVATTDEEEVEAEGEEQEIEEKEAEVEEEIEEKEAEVEEKEAEVEEEIEEKEAEVEEEIEEKEQEIEEKEAEAEEEIEEKEAEIEEETEKVAEQEAKEADERPVINDSKWR